MSWLSGLTNAAAGLGRYKQYDREQKNKERLVDAQIKDMDTRTKLAKSKAETEEARNEANAKVGEVMAKMVESGANRQWGQMQTYWQELNVMMNVLPVDRELRQQVNTMYKQIMGDLKTERKEGEGKFNELTTQVGTGLKAAAANRVKATDDPGSYTHDTAMSSFRESIEGGGLGESNLDTLRAADRFVREGGAEAAVGSMVGRQRELASAGRAERQISTDEMRTNAQTQSVLRNAIKDAKSDIYRRARVVALTEAGAQVDEAYSDNQLLNAIMKMAETNPKFKGVTEDHLRKAYKSQLGSRLMEDPSEPGTDFKWDELFGKNASDDANAANGAGGGSGEGGGPSTGGPVDPTAARAAGKTATSPTDSSRKAQIDSALADTLKNAPPEIRELPEAEDLMSVLAEESEQLGMSVQQIAKAFLNSPEYREAPSEIQRFMRYIANLPPLNIPLQEARPPVLENRGENTPYAKRAPQ